MVLSYAPFINTVLGLLFRTAMKLNLKVVERTNWDSICSGMHLCCSRRVFFPILGTSFVHFAQLDPGTASK